MTVLCGLSAGLRMCVDGACVMSFGGLCWFGFEGGLFWGLPGFLRERFVCVIIWFCRF